MAIENRVLLNGIIQNIRKIKESDKQIVQITIGLQVVRRPDVAYGNENGTLKSDIVLVHIREKEKIEYLQKENASQGDLLEVFGVFCTLRGIKHFICKCGAKNSYEGTMSFVHPLYLRLSEIHPKTMEVVSISEKERDGSKEEILEVLRLRKNAPGSIIATKYLGQNESDMRHYFSLTIREKVSDKDVRDYLKSLDEVSNHIYAMGNLCNDPQYNPIERGGRVCTYQLGINRKVYIESDGPNVRTDYPWIKSLGDQADKDRDMLEKGSLVYIDGSIQARDKFFIEKECCECGQTCKLLGRAMEIVPYSVEYLRDFKNPCLDETDDMDDYTIPHNEEEGNRETMMGDDA